MALAFWVDEDRSIWQGEKTLLRGYGWEVMEFGDASAGLNHVKSVDPRDVDLIILDVMLVPGVDFAPTSSNDVITTNNTGLVLADEICNLHSGFGKKILFFSSVTDAKNIGRIKHKARTIGGRYAPKSSENQDIGFIDLLIDLKLWPSELLE